MTRIQNDHIKLAHLDLTQHGYDRVFDFRGRGLESMYKFFTCVQVDSDTLAVYTTPDDRVLVTINEVANGDRLMLTFKGAGAARIRDKFAARLKERKDFTESAPHLTWTDCQRD